MHNDFCSYGACVPLEIDILEVQPSVAGRRYSLGQFFIEWDVRIDPAHLGAFTADATHPLVVYVDGVRDSGDPAAIELTPRTEIAVVYGKAPPRIPARYAFPAGG